MAMEQIVKAFKADLAKQDAIHHAMGVLQYDSVTAMPKGGYEELAATMGYLSELDYKFQVSTERKEMLEQILAHKDEVDSVTRREAEELSEELERVSKIPMDEYVAYQMEQNVASAVWEKAKHENDYQAFKPHLEKLIDFNKRFAGYFAPEKPVYDALLDQFEKGLTMATLDQYFTAVRKEVVPLLKATQEKGRAIDESFLSRPVPVHMQQKFSDELMKILCIDREYCGIAETEHPFTTNFSKHDVRITTHYHEDAFVSSMYSVIHEGGHALYELHTGDELLGSPLAQGTSMSVHESQSRFFENIIGRSEAFCAYLLPRLQELFPQQMQDVTAEKLFLAVNNAKPSLIRTEADELTYSLHIMVRYEIEKRIFAGELSVDELPEAWNKLYKEYLGVDVPDDTHGILQDSHWAGGMFGYFPSYSLGSAYASQILARMRKELDFDGCVRRGELQPIVDWLTEHVFKYGQLKKPGEVIELACGAPFDPTFYTDYLKEKFTKVFAL